MPALIDLTGQTFGHLTVIGRAPDRFTKSGLRRTQWHCQCDCGRTINVDSQPLRRGEQKSCGHDRLGGFQRYIKKHMTETPGTSLAQLNDRPPTTNKTGYRNISYCWKNGKLYYRVELQYQRQQYHGGLFLTLEAAIKARDELRRKVWPNYKDK
ncbi:hypothetical protein GPK34_00315 [Secundilactobacillus kimchicus]|uniref:hypothetical protein n=1 Tax=Secundilactobacillus kimchicus TaxID=528209 RepID=UPI001C01F227|nr:hypothetical protein [Secundilactobacillus kimchicus]MBT9670480.1 hypothetical protein [Secundilactobacillus kimchicus]